MARVRLHVTIRTGRHGVGTHGDIRGPIDQPFHSRNAGVLRVTNRDSAAFCILSRVIVENGVALTPDRILPQARLFEGPRSE
jgi:hypothetical protein